MRRLVLWLTLMMAAWGMMLMASTTAVAQHPVEDESLRTKDSKTFILAPGQRQTVFGHDLHYLDNGELKDVNLVFVNNIADQGPIEVRVQGVNLTIKDPATGVSIKYTLPETPTVTSDKVSYSHKGLTWEYSLTKRGTKLSAVVSSAVGLETYKFPFTVTGTTASINNGRLETEEFVVRRPKIVDDNGAEFFFNWVQDAGELKLTFDDAGFALPYTIDPSTTFSIASDANDGDATGDDATYASIVCETSDAADDTIIARNSDTGPVFRIDNAFTKWDTSPIPDTATVLSADFEPFINSFSDTNSRNFIGEYFAWGAVTCADWSASPGSDAFSSDITGLATGVNTIAMSSLTSINKTGFTELRLGVSGGEPASNNAVIIRSREDGGGPELIVTYDIDPDITSFSPTKVDDASTEAVTATGTDFDTDAQLIMQKSGESDINCTAEVTNGPGTSITATCDFTGALIGLWNARVENGPGHNDTLTNATTVIKIPVVTSATPDKVDDETTEVMTVDGTNFESDAQVFMVKGGESDITCTAESVNGPGTQITTTCNFTGVALGLWDVRVENDTDSQFHDTSTNETRVYSRPAITTIVPVDAENDAGFTLTVNGSEFDTVDPAVVTLTRSGESTITCTGGTSSATVLTRSCPITGALEGLWSVVVTNGTVLAATLTDGLDIWSTLGTPTITSVTPSLSSNTSPVNLTLFGTNFDDADTQSLTGAQVTMSGPGSPIICTGEDVTAGNTRVAATCDITSATTGLWQITVTNNGGAQATIGFTVAGSGGAGSSGDPDGSIDDIFAYDSVLEDDDLLVVVVYNLIFTSTSPISDTFLCRFLASGVDQNASEILVFNDLGYGLGLCSFYWTAAQKLASSIEFENPNGEIYQVVLQGKASAFDIPLRFTNENVKWRDPRNTSALLSRDIVALATRFQNDTDWSANEVVLLSFLSGQTVLSSDGESFFGRAIPNLASMIPDLFSSSVTSPFIDEREFGFSETDRLQRFWIGSVLEDSMQAGADLFGLDNPIYFTTFIGLAIIIGVIALGRVATGNLEFGIITTAVTIPLMAVIGLLSLNFVVMAAALAVLALGFVLFLRRAS